MELIKIEKLLERYFEGETSLIEESQLQDYFSEKTIAPHLEPYRSMFSHFASARKETYNKEIILAENTVSHKRWWYSIAALVIVAIGIGFFFNNSGDGLTSEQREALVAFEEMKNALNMISSNMNNGIEEMAYLNEFEATTKTIFK